MSISVDFRDFERGFADLLAALRNGAHLALVTAVKAAHETARTTDAFKDGPDAKLRQSIRFSIDEPFKGRVLAGGRGIPEAQFIEFGTPPHDIRPKRAKALRFIMGGEVVFRRFVRHPGTKERPFMQRAAWIGEAMLEQNIEAFTERPIARFNNGG